MRGGTPRVVPSASARSDGRATHGNSPDWIRRVRQQHAARGTVRRSGERRRRGIQRGDAGVVRG
eukprot:1540930-Pleurochrysis_carterae.AAC.1